MFKAKVVYGYRDERETETADVLGTYETWDEAAEVAEDKFSSILDGLRGNTYLCPCDIRGSQYNYWVDDDDGRNVESGLVFSGPDYYCEVAVVEI